jgi:hypothetical protein
MLVLVILSQLAQEAVGKAQREARKVLTLCFQLLRLLVAVAVAEITEGSNTVVQVVQAEDRVELIAITDVQEVLGLADREITVESILDLLGSLAVVVEEQALMEEILHKVEDKVTLMEEVEETGFSLL